MPWVEALSDPKELRRCIRDLVALSTLPAAWKTDDPRQIADSVAQTLLSMIRAEFVHIALPELRGEPVVELTRTREGTACASSSAIRDSLLACLPNRMLEPTAEIPSPLGKGTVRTASAPIGQAGDGFLVAGSREPHFPTTAQRILLEMGGNQAAMFLDRWRAEAEGRRFAALVERSSDFIGFASLDGGPRYLNPAGRKLVGLDDLDEPRRVHVLDYVMPEEQARVRDELWPLVLREGRWTGEIAFRHFKSGAAIPFLVDWFRIDDLRTGRPMNIAAVCIDLTAHKRAEAELRHLNETLEQRVAERTAELAEANEWLLAERTERERTDARLQELQLELFLAARLSAAGQMAAALAHELNQPLTAATNFVNAARRGLGKGDGQRIATVREDMDAAVQQVLRAGQIMRRLRDFASRGDTAMRIESVATMVEEASALALTGSRALGVEVRFRFDPDASLVFADRIQIQQVLLNLIRNALDAMTTSERRELAVTTTLLDREMVEIGVADSGPGLPEDVVNRLFEPFVSTKPHGMGLGLSICRTIIEAHGGSIRALERPQGGAEFRFTLGTARGNPEDDVG